MNYPSFRRLLAPLLLALPLATAAAPDPAAIDALIDVLFKPAEFEQATLAPDGSHLAITREFDDHKVLVTLNLATKDIKTLRQDGRLDIGRVRWSGADNLIFEMLYQPQYYDGLYLADENLHEAKYVKHKPSENYRLAQTLPWDGKSVLLTRSEREEDIFSPLFRLTLKTNGIAIIEPNPGRVVAWHIDPKTGNARLAGAAGSARNPDDPAQPAIVEPGRSSEMSLLFRDKPGDPWRAEPVPKRSEPVFFDPSGNTVFLSYPDASGRRVLQNYDLRAHRLTGEPAGDANHDLNALPLIEPLTGVPFALAYETEKPNFIWLNPQYRQVHALLQNAFPGQVILLYGYSGKNKMVFRTASDAQPGVIYEYDATEQKVTPLISARPDAMKREWAKMTPVWFAARDGYQVPAYLTLPRNRQPGQAVPMIALSHGGPQARDAWDFNSEVQFLAALGYGVLQVNYRGSTGYGEKHELANHIEVHERSVDDVVDGLRWSVTAGFADPKRLVAYGGSYGGYISLAIATRYPDLLAATVGFAGVYDWVAERKFDSDNFDTLLHWRADYYVDPKLYPERFHNVAPVYFADKVRCPVLLMHGGEDKTVDISQSKRMATALRDAGKSVEVIKDAQGIHGLPHAKERVTFYRKLAEFLLRNVPPDPI